MNGQGYKLIPPEHYQQPGRIPPDKRDGVKRKVLRYIGESNTIRPSCQKAGITPATWYKWVRTGYVTPEELQEVRDSYQDRVRSEISKRALEGVDQYVLSQGRIVRNDDGTPMMFKRTDNRLLLAIAQHVLPEWREDNQRTTDNSTTVIVNGVATQSQFVIPIDIRDLNPMQLEQIKQILADVDDRKNGVVEALPEKVESKE